MQPLPRTISLHDSDYGYMAKIVPGGANAMVDSHPVMAAWTQGRTVDACREMRKKTANLNCIDDFTAERIHRIAVRYEQSLSERTVCGDWVVDDAVDDIRIAYRAGSAYYQTAITIDFDGEDPLPAFVALCENDLSMGCDMNCESVQQLSEELCHPVDSVWRIQRTEQFGREDNIRQLSCLDALDEPDAALWISLYPPQADAKRLRGITLPPPVGGRTRNMHSRSNFFIEPVKAVTGEFLPGFRVVHTTCTRPSVVIQKFLSVTPRRLMIRQLRDKASKLRKSLRDQMGNCAVIRYRLANSSRAGFYNSVAKRLSGSNHLSLGSSSQVESAFLPRVKEEEDAVCKDRDTPSQKTSISDVETMADLTMHLTTNWADAC